MEETQSGGTSTPDPWKDGARTLAVQVFVHRNKHDLTQAELAVKAWGDGHTAGEISNIERRQANPTLDRISRLAFALGVPAHVLLQDPYTKAREFQEQIRQLTEDLGVYKRIEAQLVEEVKKMKRQRDEAISALAAAGRVVEKQPAKRGRPKKPREDPARRPGGGNPTGRFPWAATGKKNRGEPLQESGSPLFFIQARLRCVRGRSRARGTGRPPASASPARPGC